MKIFKPSIVGFFTVLMCLSACNNIESSSTQISQSPSPIDKIPSRVITKDDKFTYAKYDEVRVTHIDLNLDVKFDAEVLDGICLLYTSPSPLDS